MILVYRNKKKPVQELEDQTHNVRSTKQEVCKGTTQITVNLSLQLIWRTPAFPLLKPQSKLTTDVHVEAVHFLPLITTLIEFVCSPV